MKSFHYAPVIPHFCVQNTSKLAHKRLPHNCCYGIFVLCTAYCTRCIDSPVNCLVSENLVTIVDHSHTMRRYATPRRGAEKVAIMLQNLLILLALMLASHPAPPALREGPGYETSIMLNAARNSVSPVPATFLTWTLSGWLMTR